MNDLIPHWSKSSLSTVLDGCSLQWWLKKVRGLPDPGGPATWRGTATHAAIEYAERCRLAGVPCTPEQAVIRGIEDLHRAVDAAGPDEEVWARHATNLNQLEAEVRDATANWYEAELKPDGGTFHSLVAGWTPIGFEVQFNVPIPSSSRTLRGFIDAVYYDPDAGQYVVVDLKTAGRLDRWKSAEGHEREGALYIHAAKTATSLSLPGDVRMEWHVMRIERGKTKRFEGARRVVLELEGYHTLWAWDDITRADRILAEGLFAPNPHWNLCSARWCPFFHGCQVTGELQPV